MPHSELALEAQQGFSDIAVDDALKQDALRNLDDWLASDKFAGLRAPGD